MHESHPINTNIAGLVRWFSKIFSSLYSVWINVASALEGLRAINWPDTDISWATDSHISKICFYQ